MHRVARSVLYLGTVTTVLGFGKLHAATVGSYDFTSSSRFLWSLGYAGLMGLAAYSAGLPDRMPRSRRGLPAGLVATVGGAAAFSVVQLVFGSAVLPRFVVFSSAMVLVPFYALCGLLAAGGRERREERERVVVVADQEDALTLMRDITDAPERPATVVWALRLDDDEELLETVENTRATVVVLDRGAQIDEEIVAQAAELHARGIRIRTLSGFYDEWLGKFPLGELERMSLLFDVRELHNTAYARIKRFLDVAAGIAGVAVLAAAIPIVAVGNLVGNRGPLFYRQARVGKAGAVFQMLKFRTMRPDDGGSSSWTQEHDPRITPFGAWLRRIHLDELPQVLNILRGDLSLVGPRPEQPGYVEDLTEKIPFYALRHVVRPGLTGWAQVKYAYGASAFDAIEKLQYEFFYLRHQSLRLDARIIGRTLRHVVAGEGR